MLGPPLSNNCYITTLHKAKIQTTILNH